MKKTVALILLILPIFLMIVISFAGRIISQYVHIPVTEILFLDDLDEELEKNIITLDVGEEITLNIKVMPELASNKTVSFINQHASLEFCTISKSGVVKGQKYGNSLITVVSNDNPSIKSVIEVRVFSDDVEKILLPDQFILTLGSMGKITYTIKPDTAVNNLLIWSIDDTSVATINPISGNIVALGEGTAIVTCTADNGVEASTTLIVSGDHPLTILELSNNQLRINENSIDLIDYVVITNDDYNYFQLAYTVIGNQSIAQITNQGLGTLFIDDSGVESGKGVFIIVRIEIIGTTHFVEFDIFYRKS